MIEQFYKQHVRNQSLMGISRDLTSNFPDTAVVGAGGIQGVRTAEGGQVSAASASSISRASGEDTGLGGP